MALFNKHKKFPKYVKGAPPVPKKGGSKPDLPQYEPQMKDDFEKPSYYDLPENNIKVHDLEKPSFPKMPRVEEKEEFEKPKFPGMEDYDFEKPSYEMPEEDLGIPVRAPGKFELRTPEMGEPPERREPIQERPIAEERPYTHPSVQNGEPIYVKLEEYKKAVRNISLIRDRINDAEDLLAEIMQVKKEEDQQLAEWHKEITEIKNKLMEVDRGLFEVRK